MARANIIFIFLLACTAHVSAAERNLMANATRDRIWLAEVFTPAGRQYLATAIYMRASNEPKWQRISTIPTRVLSIHDVQGELAVLLNNGDWRILVPSTGLQEVDHRIGRRPPGLIKAMASDGEILWAIVMVPGGMPAATRPATQRFLEIDRKPATSTANSGATSPVLFKLIAGDWQAVAPVPMELMPGGPAACSTMGFIDRIPVLAVSDFGKDLQINRLVGGKWQRQDLPDFSSEMQLIELFQCDGITAMLVVGKIFCSVRKDISAEGPFIHLGDLSPVLPLDKLAIVPAGDREFRLIYRQVGKVSQIMERRYDLSGQPVRQAEPLVLPSPVSPNEQLQNIPMMLLVAMTLILLGTLRRRPTAQQVQSILRHVRPAPLGRRAAAGLIDLTPVLVCGLIAAWQGGQSAGSGEVPTDLMALAGSPVAAIGIVIYLLHTTVIEVWKGRSAGKIMLGLFVTTAEGNQPKKISLIVRNSMRLIDVVAFPPLLLMAAFSPVHQRLADVVAGTLVVLPGRPTEEEAVVSEEQPQEE